MENFKQQFITEHQLTASYLDSTETWVDPLADELARQFRALRKADPQRAMIIGISGCQGSGKSTMADYLQLYLKHQHALNGINCSMDDFYLSLADRKDLAKRIHPLLVTRGVPGTHYIDKIYDCLTQAKQRKAFELPVFDKLRDDISSQPRKVKAGIDILIVEGWCLGAHAQAATELDEPINELERLEDAEGEFRRFVNDQLESGYAALSSYFDSLVMLKAPSFAVVKNWRFEQERKLHKQHTQRLATNMQQQPAPTAMNSQDIARFIQFFQRITEQLIATLPEQADRVLELDAKREIIAYRANSKSLNSAIQKTVSPKIMQANNP